MRQNVKIDKSYSKKCFLCGRTSQEFLDDFDLTATTIETGFKKVLDRDAVAEARKKLTRYAKALRDAVKDYDDTILIEDLKKGGAVADKLMPRWKELVDIVPSVGLPLIIYVDEQIGPRYVPRFKEMDGGANVKIQRRKKKVIIPAKDVKVGNVLEFLHQIDQHDWSSLSDAIRDKFPESVPGFDLKDARCDIAAILTGLSKSTPFSTEFNLSGDGTEVSRSGESDQTAVKVTLKFNLCRACKHIAQAIITARTKPDDD